jgi:hypothetical protein
MNRTRILLLPPLPRSFQHEPTTVAAPHAVVRTELDRLDVTSIFTYILQKTALKQNQVRIIPGDFC